MSYEKLIPARGLAVAYQPKPFCTSATTLVTSSSVNLKLRRRPLHDDDADRHRSLEVRARRPTGKRTNRSRRCHRGGNYRCTLGHIPLLTVSRPPMLCITVAWRFSKPETGKSQSLNLAEAIERIPETHSVLVQARQLPLQAPQGCSGVHIDGKAAPAYPGAA